MTVETAVAQKRVYLTNPISGEVVHVGDTIRESCTGATLFASYTSRPNGRAWPGRNGELFVRLSDAEAAELRAGFGSVCDCEINTQVLGI